MRGKDEDVLGALARRAAAGDEAATNELISRLEAQAFGELLRRVGDWQLAEDLSSIVFERFCRHLPPRRSVRGLLFSIVRTVAKDAQRSPEPRRVNQDGPDPETVPAGPDANPAAAAATKEAIKKFFEQAVSTGLPPRVADLVRLRFERGLDIKEIAKEWDVSAASLRQLLKNHKAKTIPLLQKLGLFRTDKRVDKARSNVPGSADEKGEAP